MSGPAGQRLARRRGRSVAALWGREDAAAMACDATGRRGAGRGSHAWGAV